MRLVLEIITKRAKNCVKREAQWGVVGEEDKYEEKRRQAFENETLPKAMAWMAIVTHNYRDNIHKFFSHVGRPSGQTAPRVELKTRL